VARVAYAGSRAHAAQVIAETAPGAVPAAVVTLPELLQMLAQLSAATVDTARPFRVNLENRCAN